MNDTEIQNLGSFAYANRRSAFGDLCTEALNGNAHAVAPVLNILNRTRGYVPHVVLNAIDAFMKEWK